MIYESARRAVYAGSWTATAGAMYLLPSTVCSMPGHEYRFSIPLAKTEWSEPREEQPWPEPDPALAALWRMADA